MNTKSKSMKGSAGFTLIELIVVTATMGIVILAVSSAMVQGTNNYATNISITNLEAGAGFTMERLTDELSHAQLVGPVGTNGLSVTFHVPVDADGNGTPLDKFGNVEWGYDGVLGRTRRIRFVALQKFSESTRGEDVNGNGSTFDRFYIGRIEAETIDAAGNPLGDTTILGPSEVMVTGPTPGLDADGDGTPDPLFQNVSGRLLIRLIMGRRDDRDRFHMTTKLLSLDYRN